MLLWPFFCCKIFLLLVTMNFQSQSGEAENCWLTSSAMNVQSTKCPCPPILDLVSQPGTGDIVRNLPTASTNKPSLQWNHGNTPYADHGFSWNGGLQGYGMQHYSSPANCMSSPFLPYSLPPSAGITQYGCSPFNQVNSSFIEGGISYVSSSVRPLALEISTNNHVLGGSLETHKETEFEEDFDLQDLGFCLTPNEADYDKIQGNYEELKHLLRPIRRKKGRASVQGYMKQKNIVAKTLRFLNEKWDCVSASKDYGHGRPTRQVTPERVDPCTVTETRCLGASLLNKCAQKGGMSYRMSVAFRHQKWRHRCGSGSATFSGHECRQKPSNLTYLCGVGGETPNKWQLYQKHILGKSAVKHMREEKQTKKLIKVLCSSPQRTLRYNNALNGENGDCASLKVQ
ncbi:unnamed protein product [Clavelina lepadiformis]|uniref:Uncharacterized protein n=1 Tax=Clavelina lepadiformis TaxID=159417 RepID=A0ABP0F3U4_CLALP